MTTVARHHANRTDQRGIAMAELTIVLPLMLLMILGVAEIGRALVRYNALSKSVQDGARYAAAYALVGTTASINIDAQLLGEIRNVVVYGNPDGVGTPILTGLAPEQISATDVGGGQLRVMASYPYQPLIGARIPNFGFGASADFGFTMQAAVSMRAL